MTPITDETAELVKTYQLNKQRVLHAQMEMEVALAALETSRRQLMDRLDECRDLTKEHTPAPVLLGRGAGLDPNADWFDKPQTPPEDDAAVSSKQIIENTDRPEVRDAINENPGRHA